VRYVFTATGLLSRVPYAAVGTDNVYLAAWLVFFYLLVLGLCLAPRRFLTPAAGACAAVSLAVCLMLSYFDFHSRNFFLYGARRRTGAVPDSELRHRHHGNRLRWQPAR
jgi:hypothetical protein